MISTKEYTIEEWLDVKYCIGIRARSEEEALERYFEGHYDEKRRKLFSRNVVDYKVTLTDPSLGYHTSKALKDKLWSRYSNFTDPTLVKYVKELQATRDKILQEQSIEKEIIKRIIDTEAEQEMKVLQKQNLTPEQFTKEKNKLLATSIKGYRSITFWEVGDFARGLNKILSRIVKKYLKLKAKKKVDNNE
jgi:hypothetical protein